MTERFVIGIIGSPFGIKGSVKVKSCSGEIEHLLKLRSVIVSKDGKERELQIEESSPSPPAVIMRFAGIDSPEAAKTLNGGQLIVGREDAAPLREGEFYVEDLKGLPVFTESGEIIGHITDIIEGGGGELAEIQLSGEEKRFVPFRSEFFPVISVKEGKVILKNLWVLE